MKGQCDSLHDLLFNYKFIVHSSSLWLFECFLIFVLKDFISSAGSNLSMGGIWLRIEKYLFQLRLLLQEKRYRILVCIYETSYL